MAVWFPSGIALFCTVCVRTSGAYFRKSAVDSSVTFFGASLKLSCVGLAAWHIVQCLVVIASTSASLTAPPVVAGGRGAVSQIAQISEKAAIGAAHPNAFQSSPASTRLM